MSEGERAAELSRRVQVVDRRPARRRETEERAREPVANVGRGETPLHEDEGNGDDQQQDAGPRHRS